MAIVVVDASCLKQADSQPNSWSDGRRPLGAALHSPDELSELSQWPGHDDSTINIVVVIIIIITSLRDLSDLWQAVERASNRSRIVVVTVEADYFTLVLLNGTWRHVLHVVGLILPRDPCCAAPGFVTALLWPAHMQPTESADAFAIYPCVLIN